MPGGRAGRDVVLRVSLAAGGVGVIVLGILTVVAGVEGADGPTRILGELGYRWEIIFVAVSIPIIAAMMLAGAVIRSTTAWIVAGIAALALVSAGVVAFLRMAGVVTIFLPLANWLPGAVLVALWSWLAARAGARIGRAPARVRRFAGFVLVGQLILVGGAGAMVLLTRTQSAAANIAGGAMCGTALALIGVTWLLLAATWRGPRRPAADPLPS